MPRAEMEKPQKPLLLSTLEMIADGISPETTERRRVVSWVPQEGPQTDLVITYRNTFEVFFGGARGGGKTDGMLGDFIEHEKQYGRSARGVFFRRIAKDLEDVVRRGLEIFTPLGWTFNGSTNTFRAPSGATLKIRHCRDAAVADSYQGHSYTRVYIEEVQQWPTPDAINKLRATLRSAEGVQVGLRLTGNPGGVGHGWVKARYVDPAPNGHKVMVDAKTGKEYVFIPSKLEDNKILMQKDPGYEKVILGVDNEELAKAWRWGLWDIIAGGFFNGIWNRESVLAPFTIPPTWRFAYSYDWGSAKPSSLGAWAISDGTPIISGWCRGRVFPRGSIVRIDEDYTVAPDDAPGTFRPNVGLRLSNLEAGARIARFLRERQPVAGWAYGVADPSIFSEQGGPSIYEQLRTGARTAERWQLRFEMADNSRETGWSRMISLMRGAGSLESPGLYVMDRCEHWLRTVPVLARDEKNLDDIDTEAEDHPADESRYFVMSVAPQARTRTVRNRL